MCVATLVSIAAVGTVSHVPAAAAGHSPRAAGASHHGTMAYPTANARRLSAGARAALVRAVTPTSGGVRHYQAASSWHLPHGWVVSVAPQRYRHGVAVNATPRTMFNVLVLRVHGAWRAAAAGRPGVAALLRHVSHATLSTRGRRAMFPGRARVAPAGGPTPATQQYSSYVFPWPATKNGAAYAWEVRQGWHDCACYGFAANQGIDFGPKDAGDSNILAAASGVVASMCRGTGGEAEINVTTNGTSEKLGYLHLNLASVDAQGIHPGVAISQGQVLGHMWTTAGQDNCGHSSGTHLHMYFPTKPFTIDGVTFTAADAHVGATLYSHQYPTAPVVSVVRRTATTISLSWTEAGSAGSFDVKRNGVTVATGLGQRSFTDSRLTPSTFYHYQVVAVSGGQTAASTDLVTATSEGTAIRADINGDGRTDNIYVYPPGGVVWTFRSKGDGTFTPASYALPNGFDAGGGTWTTADINGDGKADLVYFYPQGGIVWTFRSKGDGTFTSGGYGLPHGFDAGGGTWTTADFNGDGKADLVYFYPQGGIVWTFRSKGDGTFTSAGYGLPHGFDGINGRWSTADINGDGRADLVYVYPPGDVVWTFRSKGDGTFTPVQYALPHGFDASNGTWMSADINGDGRADLAYFYPPGGIVWTFRSKGDGTFTSGGYGLPHGFDGGSGSWTAADISGDGKADLVYFYPPGGIVWTFRSKGDGTFTSGGYGLPHGFDGGNGTWTTTDVNGDGKADLEYIYPPGHILWTFRSKGDGTFTAGGYGVGPGFDAAGGRWQVGAYTPATAHAPRDVTVQAQRHQVTISWHQTPSVAPIAAYRIATYHQGVLIHAQVFHSAGHTEVVQDLKAGTHYQFSVAAINAGGVGRATLSQTVVTKT
jgi:hypothetical protein